MKKSIIPLFLILSLAACDDCDSNCQSHKRQLESEHASQDQQQADVSDTKTEEEKAAELTRQQEETDKTACEPVKIGTIPEGITIYVISHECSRIPGTNDLYVTSRGGILQQ